MQSVVLFNLAHFQRLFVLCSGRTVWLSGNIIHVHDWPRGGGNTWFPIMPLRHQSGSRTFIDNMAAALGLDLKKFRIWQHSLGAAKGSRFQRRGVRGHMHLNEGSRGSTGWCQWAEWTSRVWSPSCRFSREKVRKLPLWACNVNAS